VRNRFNNRCDQILMGTRSPEGGNPFNIDPISLRRAPEQGRFHGVKTPETMKQQASDAALEAAKELLGKRWGATVFENPIRVPRPLPQKPGEQRGEGEPFQPNPAELQTPQRRRTRRERARLAQDPEIRELAKELFGALPDEGVTDIIAMAIRRYRNLPPDEALKRYNHDFRKGGFYFT
jgi:hypothetical protein